MRLLKQLREAKEKFYMNKQEKEKTAYKTSHFAGLYAA
jgi:hypothetical protein